MSVTQDSVNNERQIVIWLKHLIIEGCGSVLDTQTAQSGRAYYFLEGGEKDRK